jgi:SpoVK/Ycf46/Vps4 family AAA+-type ATPase
MVQFLSLYDRRCGSYYANNVRAAYLSFADIIAHAGANQADDAAVQRLKLLLTLWDADNGDQPTSGGPAVAKGRPFSERAAGAEGLKRALEELNGLIGLDSVKADVNRLVSYIQVQKARSEIGLRTAEMALHTIFYGNPGTGKTTVARLVARIYREIGVLERGHLVETDRSGLVAGWLGQTALKVQATVKNALGGVLFIDEAYTLAASERGRDEFGFEAIDTLLKLMEDNRGKLIVIAAGYTAPMNRFLNSNPGLKSRFTRSLHFEDYRPEELLAIFRRFCEEADYILSAGADDAVAKFLTTAYSARNDTFGNARLVRNAFEAAARNHASRVEHESSADRRALQTIVAADIQSDEAEGFGSDS